MKRTERHTFNEDTYNDVVAYFNSNHDNRTNVIAKHFGLKNSYTSWLIDVYLSKKKNYMGYVVDFTTTEKIHKNCKRVKSECLDTGEIEEFKSITELAKVRGVSIAYLSNKINCIGSCEIKHHSDKKTYIYKLI